jgi:IrrE N-terminal-like domain
MQIFQEAAPVSRVDLEDVGVRIRRLLGYTEKKWLPVPHIIEHALPQLFGDDFAFRVAEPEELGADHGYADPDSKELVLRADVYAGMIEGRGRDRMTGMHEVSHLFLHPRSRLFRRMREEPPPVFRQVEWQAKCLAGATMMPAQLLAACSSVREVAKEFGVSMDAADYRLRQIKRWLPH